ncbi:hypothetical protein Q4540_03485 [Pseudoalteromonas carrageenovora]|uniref:hypothetical protein n=1 Tax=Pseudoalteromonas carrageenovora TaxID=227 RepID=UPI0026E23A3B|nr:hypothetical protein [Pseudoalteromonas carrageenovora]MDO6635140.1 hypothetical protein [Pseudoalteromonas carrageenovora]MDO6647544.1 hypothetical protein [Pseudoalteromonas carrageenovora]
METCELPKKYKNKYSKIYHATSIENAFSILNSGRIFGTDPDKHANFGIIPRNDLAKTSEVLLKLRWKGKQKIYFGDPFGHFKPDYEKNGPEKNVLYHVFIQGEICECCETINNDRYWQSNLYPESEGLEFSEVKWLLHEDSKPHHFFLRLFSKQRREEHADFVWHSKVKKKLEEYSGTKLSVPPKNA